ncbi:OmpA family protein [Ferrimonas sediminum]|uniref:OmpA family protein n=1 Tax=Ferrimonas sediminum TaxID=718193 RepID=A0A1G8ZW76_9GAMM|nr:OmpA family protein [Ferrimonas sediminum]SDK19241.1 OmpA family protein [Ferrimonas sediminum]
MPAFLNNLFLTVVVFPSLAFASVTEYQTELERASWNFDGDKFQCRLIHDVSDFGQFILSQNAGGPLTLQLNSDWLPSTGIEASFRLLQPQWQSADEQADRRFGARWQSGHATMVQTAEGFLQSLELGWNWQAQLSDGQGQQWWVNSANVHGQPASLAMRRCRKQLLPMSYEQVRRLQLSYPSGSVEADGQMARYIDAAAQYTLADPRITKVLVDGHTDDEGDSLSNLVLSRTRADEIAARLVAAGVPADKLEIRGHGERFPLASNGSRNGRATNRRVTIRLVMNNDGTPISTDDELDLNATLPKSLNGQVTVK